MSVEFNTYLVDWDDFQERIHDLDDGDDAFVVLEELEAERHDRQRRALDFMEAFDAFQRSWKSDGRLYFKEVFDSVLWPSRGIGRQIVELEAEHQGDLFGIDTALKPETVKELSEMGKRFDLEECRQHFEKYDRENSYFESFDEWKEYAEEWMDLLHRAAAEDKGLIVAVFG